MKRILITGGAGFIAHHLIGQVLKRTDWEIVTLDRLDYSGNLNRLHDLLQDYLQQNVKEFAQFTTILKLKLTQCLNLTLVKLTSLLI